MMQRSYPLTPLSSVRKFPCNINLEWSENCSDILESNFANLVIILFILAGIIIN